MKTKLTFKFVFVIFCLFMYSGVYASTNETYTVTAGNLGTLLGPKSATITTLVLSGQINGADIDILRKMPLLSALDIKNVQIVAGGTFSAENTQIPVYANRLPNAMFHKMTGLKSVTIPISVTDIGDHAFYGCTGLTSIKIPDKVTRIGSLAFHDCTGVTTIEIGSSLDSIGLAAFCGSLKLKNFIVSTSNTKLSAIDGVLMKGNRLIRFPNKFSTSYTIPKSVTIIEGHAFCGCTDLVNIHIPTNVKTIGVDAFYGCTKLAEVHCGSTLPPNLFSESFYNINKEVCKLFVPVGAITNYRANLDWNKFVTILEEQLLGVPDLTLNDLNIYTDQNEIVISGAPFGETISVYNLFGAMIHKMKVTDEVVRINVPANQIYLVKVAKKTSKVSL